MSGIPNRHQIMRPHSWETCMCRWLAYSGSPFNIGRILFEPTHSLVDQSFEAREGSETTNGDGFGIAAGRIISAA